MKRIILLSIGLIISTHLLNAQSKKELQAEVNRLTSEIAEKEQEIREAKKNENISVAKATEFEAQVAELKDANATLLGNIKIFTEASQQRSTSIGQTLESLRIKEAKLKVLNDEFGKNDSIALLVLTGFKQTLGEDALIGVQEGAVVVELNKTMLFGSSPTSVKISADGQGFLDKIASVIKAQPDTEATLIGQLDSIGKKEISNQRSWAILNGFRGASGIEPERISMSIKESSAETYQIRIHPRLNRFYLSVRETVKN